MNDDNHNPATDDSTEDNFLNDTLESLDAMAEAAGGDTTDTSNIPRLEEFVEADSVVAAPAAAGSDTDMASLRQQLASELLNDMDEIIANVTHQAVSETVEKAMIDAKNRLEETLLAELKEALHQVVDDLTQEP